jgi:hypothetical protein
MESTSYSCQAFMKLEFSEQIFEKYSNIKFHENLSNGSQVVASGREDRHDKTKSHFWKFYERAQNLGNVRRANYCDTHAP